MGLWDAETGREILTHREQRGVGAWISFGSGGRRLICRSRDGTVTAWDAEMGRAIPTAVKPYGVVEFSPDGLRLATWSTDGSMTVADGKTGQVLLTPQGPVDRFVRLEFTPDGRRLALGSAKGVVKLWDAETGKEMAGHESLEGSHLRLHLSSDQRRMVWRSDDGRLWAWDIETGRHLLTIKKPAPYRTRQKFARPTDPPASFGICRAGRSRLWKPSERKGAGRSHGRAGRQRSLGAFYRRRTGLGLGIRERHGVPHGTWRRTGRRLTLKRSCWRGCAVAVVPTADACRRGRVPRLIKVWEAATGQEIHSFNGHTGAIVGLAFSPDGRRLASASKDTTVRLWDLETGQELRTFQVHTQEVACVCFSPDGRRQAWGGGRAKGAGEGGVRGRWRRIDARKSLTGHRDMVTDIAFSPERSWHLATSASEDGIAIRSCKDTATGAR